MTSANRATRIGKLHSLLKKAYKPTMTTDNRPLMEHLLYGCLLENSPYELADEALARLEQEYFDWNEVRVTTIIELSEVLARLPDPTSSAIRLKKNLHGLFETTYSFDLEELKKQNLGKAVQKFEKLPAMTPFVLAYITQHGLGGHAIPLDSAALRFFWLADIINENELKTGRVTGLERAIPKSKGIEFSSLLHQAAVALNIDPNDDTARGIALLLNPELEQKVADHVALVKKRRVAKAKAAAKAASDAADAEAEAKAKPTKPAKPKAAKPTKSTKQSIPPAKSATKATEQADKQPTAETASAPKPAEPKKADKPAKSKTGKPKTAPPAEVGAESSTNNSESKKNAEETKSEKLEPAKKTAGKKSPEKKPAEKKPAEKKPAEKKPAEKKPAEKKPAEKKSAETKSAEKKLAEKKPMETKPADDVGADDQETAASTKSASETGTKRKPR